MKALVLVIFLGFFQITQAQLTLDSCLSQSMRHFQFDLESMAIDEEGELLVSNSSKTWYPDLNLEYRSTIQNQQLEFPSALPGNSPEIPLDFHRLLLNFSQTIYDGSVSAHRKNIERQSTATKIIQLESQAIALRSQVVKLYMSALLLDRQKDIVKAGRESLKAQLKRTESAVEEGIVQVADFRSMEAELLSMDMRQLEVKKNRELVILQLFDLMGMEADKSVKLEMPLVEVPEVSFEKRPEIRLMRSQVQLMESQKKLYSSSHVPKIQLFGSAGAGNPGYNILDNTIQPMAIVGIGLRWDFWDWNEVSNQKQVLTLRQGNMEYAIQRKITAFQSELNMQQSEIEKLNELMQNDKSIVELRQEVVDIKSSQLENGVITSSDYIIELNKLNMAQLGLEVHQLELLQAKLNYNIIAGN